MLPLEHRAAGHELRNGYNHSRLLIRETLDADGEPTLGFSSHLQTSSLRVQSISISIMIRGE